jgi:hypothetical protein
MTHAYRLVEELRPNKAHKRLVKLANELDDLVSKIRASHSEKVSLRNWRLLWRGPHRSSTE